MEYRELGRTGIKVSVIALGCEGFVANEGALNRATAECGRARRHQLY